MSLQHPRTVAAVFSPRFNITRKPAFSSKVVLGRSSVVACDNRHTCTRVPVPIPTQTLPIDTRTRAHPFPRRGNPTVRPSHASRCPSGKKPESPVSAVAVSSDENTAVVGCENGSLHGMKLSQDGAGVQHTWSKPAAASGAVAVLAIDMSADGKVMTGCRWWLLAQGECWWQPERSTLRARVGGAEAR